MMIECFLDTNVLVYAAAGQTATPAKHAVARDLVLNTQFGVSAQTLAEFYRVVTQKAKTPLSSQDVDAWIDELSARPLTPIDESLVRAGINISRRYNLRYFDAALIAAAERLGAPTFYSEDLNNGQTYGKVKVINPFLNTKAPAETRP